ncbi:MAG: hypothetical protein ACF8OB_08935 [Phycisphaeraceae bacterium JB051]
MKENTSNRKYQLCIIGLLGVIVGMTISQFKSNDAQADNQHVYAQYQSPSDSMFQTVADKPKITGDQLALFQNIFSLIKEYTAVVDNPTACSVAAIMGIDDNTSSKEEAIRMLEDTLEATRRDEVRRAIRMKLMELYNKTGQASKTQQMLRQLIVQ